MTVIFLNNYAVQRHKPRRTSLKQIQVMKSLVSIQC